MGRIVRLTEYDDDRSSKMVRRPEYDDYDPMTGITEQFYYDPETGDVGVEYVQNVEPILELNKAQLNQFDERTPYGPEAMHHVGRIPGIFLQTNPELLKDEAAVKKWLNNPDHRAFRTRPGKI